MRPYSRFFGIVPSCILLSILIFAPSTFAVPIVQFDSNGDATGISNLRVVGTPLPWDVRFHGAQSANEVFTNTGLIPTFFQQKTSARNAANAIGDALRAEGVDFNIENMSPFFNSGGSFNVMQLGVPFDFGGNVVLYHSVTKLDAGPFEQDWSVQPFADFSFTGRSTKLDHLGWVTFQAVPEPSTLLLLGSGLAGLAAWRYRKSRNP